VASPPTRLIGFGVGALIKRAVHCTPAHIHQVRAGAALTGLRHGFLSYALRSRSPDPTRLAVPGSPGFVGAASRPPRRPPDRTAPSSHQAAATTRRGGLPPPSIPRASRRTNATRRTKAALNAFEITFDGWLYPERDSAVGLKTGDTP
jgi:hypothetical protein